MAHLLHQSPRQYGIPRTRWRYQDVGQALRWLQGHSDATIYKVLKRLGFSRKKALQFIRSPDPDYRPNGSAFGRLTRRPSPSLVRSSCFFKTSSLITDAPTCTTPSNEEVNGSSANTKARVTAVMDAITGRVLFRQRSKIGRHELVLFYQQIRQAYPNAQRIYLVEDNWSVHQHPDVLQAARNHNLSLLFLPTYASWLNPIEKLWRWLRQDIVYNHQECHDFKKLRKQVEEWLVQFSNGHSTCSTMSAFFPKRSLTLYQY